MIYLDKKNLIKIDDKSFWKNEAIFWNDYGKIYRNLEASTPYQDMLSDIKNIIKKRDGQKWLDAGCGPGTMIDVILSCVSNYSQIIGIDFDGVMLDQATRRLTHNKNIEIKAGDLSKTLDFGNDTFGSIVANLVLSYVIIFNNKHVGKDALCAILEEMYRILKKDGLIVWTTPVEDVSFFKVFLASWRQVFNPLTPQYIYYGPQVLSYANKIQKKGKIFIYHFLSKSELEDIMISVGFRNIKITKTFADQAYLVSAIK